VLAAALMLRHIGEVAAANRLEQAVETALEHGPRTRDLGGQCSTAEFADVILEAYTTA
jgi:isocitrate/isopropylmalate dehydrogenase